MIANEESGATGLRLVMLQGLPASGKSTRARKILSESSKPMIRVNKDCLREMLHPGLLWSREREHLVRMAEIHLADEALKSGVSVVVDDTNLGPAHLGTWSAMAESHGLTLEVDFVFTPVGECIRRDEVRGEKRVGRTVIAGMARQFLSYKDAGYDVVFDLDGTLADNSHRIPNPVPEGFDYEATAKHVVTDAPILSTVSALMDHHETYGDRIIILTGRAESGRQYTEEWLRLHGIYELCDMVIMRPDDDRRPAPDFKLAMLRKFCNQDNVRAIYDNDTEVVRHLLSEGYKAIVPDGLPMAAAV